MNKLLIYILLIFLSIVLISSSCKHEAIILIRTIDEVKNPYQVPLTYSFSHEGENGLNSEATFTAWMLKNDHIANWLGEKKDGKEVYEPINVLWIDYRSSDIEEAKDEVSRFLKDCGFDLRKGSSTGYFTFIGKEGNLSRTGQLPSDKTWSDRSALKDNNHGRIFTRKSPDGKAYYTLGAFSRETGISHHFVSFNSARDAMHETGDWKKESQINDIPNVYPPDDTLSFSTQDHNGTAIFVMYP